jgi:hypothetical protein
MTDPGIKRFPAHWTEFDLGGHLAVEKPEVLVGDVRPCFLGLRSR